VAFVSLSVMSTSIPTYVYLSLLAAIMCSPAASHAASRYTETFTSTDDGWLARDPTIMSVTNVATGGNPDGALQGFFPAEPPPPTPPPGSAAAFLANGGGLSSNFMGDYHPQDILLFGFDFNPVNQLPTSFDFFIRGGSSTFLNRSFFDLLAATNTWHSFRFSFRALDGAWFGSTNQVGTLIANVTSIVFEVSRNGPLSQTYLLDNIFLDALPAGGGGATSASNAPQIVWNNLRTNEVYRVEASPDLVVPQWTVITTITAQTSTVATDYPATNDYRFFRMVMP
jgi:hypothetical protein